MEHHVHRRRCTPKESDILAEALEDRPETLFARQRLRLGLCPAFLIGEPARYVSALVEALPGTLFVFGEVPHEIWEVIQPLPTWTSVVVMPHQAQELGDLIVRGTGRAVRYQTVLFFTLPTPVVSLTHQAVRFMTPTDVDLVATGPGGSVGAAYGSTQVLLAEGYVAGAVVDRKLVARAHTSCQSPRYADVAVATAEAWRGQGLASAAASLVCGYVQRSGRIPVWSTSRDNTASQRIAQKLGFIPYSQVSYLTPVSSVEP